MHRHHSFVTQGQLETWKFVVFVLLIISSFGLVAGIVGVTIAGVTLHEINTYKKYGTFDPPTKTSVEIPKGDFESLIEFEGKTYPLLGYTAQNTVYAPHSNKCYDITENISKKWKDWKEKPCFFHEKKPEPEPEKKEKFYFKTHSYDPEKKEKFYFKTHSYFDPEVKKCFHQPLDTCDMSGSCIHHSREEIPCPLDIETNDESPTNQLYRELLDSEKLPSEEVIENAKKERDAQLERLRNLEKEVQEEIEKITNSAREKSKKANAEALRKMFTPELEDLARGVADVVKKIREQE